jgi:8-oxo-dGTP pyrophosphatase MutT (NUDIX family)
MTLQVGVKVLLRNSEGKVLVLKRSARYGVVEGSWDIPGGRIDPGTTLAENLTREVQEETGLTLTAEPKLIAAQDLLPKSDAPKHIVRLTYVGYADGEPVLDGVEHTEHRWVPFQELSSLENLDGYLKALIDDGTLGVDAWKS